MTVSCYTGQCVVVFGAASLQQYVFQSNRLKENIGASYLINYWLGDGLVEIAQADSSSWKEYRKRPRRDPLENPIVKDKEVNVIYVGGGNAALLCKDKHIAHKVVRTWSHRLLTEAPGLRVVAGYGVVSNSKSLVEAYCEALKNLNFCEEALPFGSALQSLPVVRTCISTGLPASEHLKGENDRDEWMSCSAASKRKQIDLAQEHISQNFQKVLEETENLSELSFAIELDEELGGRKGESHIALVHADGNGMGKLLNKVIEKENQADDEFLHNLRAFSASTTYLSHRTLEKTLLHIKKNPPSELLSIFKDKAIFPLRPIVYGGDDLTFLCDGRIGLHLAACYLREFAKGTIRVCGKDESVDACAGVAIVPTKFPFAQAYHFADQLCGLAKSHRRYKGSSEGSWLDFQIIQEGTTRSIRSLRETQYRTLEKGRQHLNERPYEVPEKSDNEPQGWDLFVKILKEFQSKRWPRSRAKGLLHALVQGPVSTKTFIENARWNGIELPPPESETGWTSVDDANKTTPYFDPLEALDFYMAIDEVDQK